MSLPCMPTLVNVSNGPNEGYMVVCLCDAVKAQHTTKIVSTKDAAWDAFHQRHGEV